MVAKSGKTFENINPVNEEVLALIAEAVMRQPFEEGNGPHERTRFLLKIADLIEALANELAEPESLDNDNAIFESKHIDIPGAADLPTSFSPTPA